MSPHARAGLNVSGEDALARIVHGGALHVSRGASTSAHAHYAWKVHVGLDAPVWYRSDEKTITGAPALLIPPGVEHSTGAVGWSCAFFLRPGSRGTPWRATPAVTAVLAGAKGQRLVALARDLLGQQREATAAAIDALSALCSAELSGPRAIDARVQAALEHLA